MLLELLLCELKSMRSKYITYKENLLLILKCNAFLDTLQKTKYCENTQNLGGKKVCGVNILRKKTNFQYQNWEDKSMRSKYIMKKIVIL